MNYDKQALIIIISTTSNVEVEIFWFITKNTHFDMYCIYFWN